MRKKTKMILSTVFCASALALAGGALMSANTLPASAAATPVMKIKGANLAIEDNVHILFALSLENVTAENVDLLVWKEVPAAYTEGTQLHTVDYGGATVDSLPVYTYDKLALKEMTQEVYVCAHTEVSGVDYYSEPIKYSILEYAYNKLGKTEATPTTNANLIATLNEMLEFGAAMQTYKNHNVDKLATNDFTYVRLAGGAKFTDGFDYGLFEVGSTVEIVGDTTDEMYNKACFEKTSGSATLTVPESIIIPEEDAPEIVDGTPVNKVYVMSDYEAGTQYAENETHVLDDYVTVTTTDCHFTSELRIYSSSTNNGYAIISSTNVITGISMNAGNKADTVNIYGSYNGLTWTEEPIATIATDSAYADYSETFTEQYKYLKLDVAGTQQVRIKNFTLTLLSTDESPVEEDVAAIVKNQAKVDAEMASFALSVSEISGATTEYLPTKGTTNTDVSINWALTTEVENVSIESNAIVTAINPMGNTTISLTATFSCGSGEDKATATKDGFTIVWKPQAANIATESLSFEDVANRTVFGEEQQVWVQNGITFTNNKAESTSNMGDYYNPVRLYKGSEVIISYDKVITKIEFTCGGSTYTDELQNSVSSLGSVTVSGSVVTLVLTTPASSVTFTPTAAIWIDSLIITYNA